MAALSRFSPCKINLLLNILGRRSDGFHELETVFFPIPCGDDLHLETTDHPGIEVTCNHPGLPVDSSNLVYRAAAAFLNRVQCASFVGVRIHLEKCLPLAAGLGGGSSNAAQVLLGLNELMEHPLDLQALHALAATLGSDVNFFLQDQPAIATGRGEKIVSVPCPPVLHRGLLVLYHPGFGVSTPWAFKQLPRFPSLLNGRPGRATEMVAAFQDATPESLAPHFFNSLEGPVFEKYPILELCTQFWLQQGAWAARMSGSGSTCFALFRDPETGLRARSAFERTFGTTGWLQFVPLSR